MKRFATGCLGVLLFLVAGWLFSVSTVSADGQAVWTGAIEGVPVWITVVARGHEITPEMQATLPWWEWGNVTSDIYLIAVDRPNTVYLIIEFDQRTDGTQEARIYSNHLVENVAQPLEYDLDGEQLKVLSMGGFPYLTITSPREWVNQGIPNYDLRVEVDGLPRGFVYGSGLTNETDGIIDTVINVHSTQPGVPDWEVTQLVNDPYPWLGHARYGAIQRMSDAPPFKAADATIPEFPYLALRVASVSRFVENPNPITFSLKEKLVQMYPFVAYQTAGHYTFYSSSNPYYLNFESPFAFYGFTGSRWPELAIRAAVFPAGDRFGPGPTERNRMTFRYSWKTDDQQLWRYALNFAGFFPYTDQVQIGGTTFWGIPYERFPDWVVSNPWPYVTFVEAVDGFPGSEGIYFYSTQDAEPWSWLSGLSATSPRYLNEPTLQDSLALHDFSLHALPPQFRGEYFPYTDSPVRLYWSPIDNRLHLKGAEGGVWYLGDAQILRSQDRNDDNYIDTWKLETVEEQPVATTPPKDASNIQPRKAVTGEIVDAVYALPDYLIYAGSSGIELKQVDYRPFLFELDPPKDKASWEQFNRQLPPNGDSTRNPLEMNTWLSAFEGESLLLPNCTMSDLRMIDYGFRFVLHVPHQIPLATTSYWSTDKLAEGSYLVQYDGTFDVENVTIPQLDLELSIPDTVQVGENARILAIVHNPGPLDVTDGLLTLMLNNSVEYSQTLEVLPGLTKTVAFYWQPSSAGELSLDGQFFYAFPDAFHISTSQTVVVHNSKKDWERSTLLSITYGQMLVLGLVSLLFLTSVLSIGFGLFRNHET